MTHTFSALAMTSSSHIEYTVDISKSSPQNLFEFVDAPRFASLCKIGCANYSKKWACPPHAPTFHEYANKWPLLYLFWFRIYLTQFSYIKNDYLKIKAANSIMKSRSDKYLRYMASIHGGYISNGSCRLCKTCRLKSGELCRYPSNMSYSFEALGMDVSSLVSKYFKAELLWYRPRKTPEYTSVVCGLLTGDALEYDYLEREYSRVIIS